jgi:hypothetical protein
MRAPLTRTLLALTVPLLLLTSCRQAREVMSRAELTQYINDSDHGLVQQQQVGGLTARLQYQPSALLVAQELETSDQKDSANIAALERKYGSSYYFVLKLSKDGKEAIRQLGSFERYSSMVSVLSFELPRLVNLTTPQRDTVALTDYLFEQSYGMSDGNSILLAFAKEKLKNKSEIEINVAECGLGVGALKFRFHTQDLENTPRLAYGRR